MKLQPIAYRMYEPGDLVRTPYGVGTVEKVDIESFEDGSFRWDEVSVKLRFMNENGDYIILSDSFYLIPISEKEWMEG